MQALPASHLGLGYACINVINQSSFNQSEDSSPSINQFNPKGSEYPITQVRARWID
jgi:hypothetical protein